MARVQEHERGLPRLHVIGDPRDRLGIHRVPLDQIDKAEQRVGLERTPVVRPDLDVDADHPAAVERPAQRRIEDERSPVGDAGLDDHVWAAPRR